MIQQNILTNTGGQQLLNESRVDSNLTIIGHTFKQFIRWWYAKMSVWHLKMLGRISVFLDDNLSITLLLKNFFLPWHRDFSFIGYVFGILIKILYLPIAVSIYILFCTLYIALILIWFLLPPVTLLFIFKSLLGI
ncbi:MAG: hypothetical protein KBH94_03300 [Caldisericia bacterium]|nr:hypothetical protein [Caldisericia bacterium]